MSTNPPTYFTCSDGDTLGKGYSGGACSSNVSHHALIMKYEDDNIVFARVSPLFLNYIIGYVLILSLRLYKEKILIICSYYYVLFESENSLLSCIKAFFVHEPMSYTNVRVV